MDASWRAFSWAYDVVRGYALLTGNAAANEIKDDLYKVHSWYLAVTFLEMIHEIHPIAQL